MKRPAFARSPVEAEAAAPGARLNDGDALPPEDRVIACPHVPSSPLEQLYRSNVAKLMRLVRHRSRRDDDVRDIVHDAFVRVAAMGSGFGKVAGPDAYLSRVVGNLVLDRAKSGAGRMDAGSVPVEDAVLPFVSPEPMLEARDMLFRLEAAMQQLKPKTREIFMAHRLDGMSYAEIADRTGLTIKGVEKQMTRAIAKLDRLLDFD